jgi:hypothetical protein
LSKREKKLKDTKVSAQLFTLSSILFMISWILAGLEESIWGFLALINFTSAITFWSTYQTEKEKLNEKGEDHHEEKRDN